MTGIRGIFPEEEAPTGKIEKVTCPACGGTGWVAVGVRAGKAFDPRRYGTWVPCEPPRGLCLGAKVVTPEVAMGWRAPG